YVLRKIYVYRMTSAFERGQPGEAIRLANEQMYHAQTWMNSSTEDARIDGLWIMRLAGALSPDDWNTRALAWEKEQSHSVDDEVAFTRWLVSRARGAVTADDAREAIRGTPSRLLKLAERTADAGTAAILGHLFLLAQEDDRATTFLTRATESCVSFE